MWEWAPHSSSRLHSHRLPCGCSGPGRSQSLPLSRCFSHEGVAPGEEELGGSEAVSAWALAGDPETPASFPVLLVAEARRFVGSRCTPPLGESGEVRWEDSGVARPWSGWRAQVRGRGGLLLRLCSGICGRPSAAGGLCPLALLGLIPPLPPPPPQSPLPLPRCGATGSCHIGGIPAAWAPAGAVETPSARAPQPEPPLGGRAGTILFLAALCGQLPPGCSPPPSLRVVSGCPPGTAESEEQTLEVLRFQVHLGPL